MLLGITDQLYRLITIIDKEVVILCDSSYTSSDHVTNSYGPFERTHGIVLLMDDLRAIVI